VLGMVIQEHKSDKMKQIVTATNLSALQVYIQRMLDRKNVSYIGINGQEITEEIVQKVDKNMPRGIYITNIDDQSPAFHAGLMRGDILVALETSEIQTVEGYADILQQYDVGTVVKITVMRKGKDGYKPIIYDVEIGSH
jgi:predicted metalloprotease with PDZ domain